MDLFFLRIAPVLSALVLAYMVLVLGRYLLYWAGSASAMRRGRGIPPGDPDALDWHLVVPCRDEQTVIGRTIAELRWAAPQAHLWVVDDASEDLTGEIVAAAAGRDPMVHPVRRRRPDARIGKGAALNAAYRAVGAWLPPGTDRSRVVLGVIDADGRLEPGALGHVANARAMGRPDTAAVQIGVVMRNADVRVPLPGRGRAANAFARLLARMQDVEFLAANTGMQLLRRRTGSVGLGGNGQFVRLSALDALAAGVDGCEGRPWPQRGLIEDYESSLELGLAGFRLTHVPEARVSQEALVSGRRFLTQRTRWSQGTLQCLRYVPRVMRSPHYGWGGRAEVLYTCLQPVVAVALVVLTPLAAGIALAGEAFYPADSAAFWARFGLLALAAFALGALPMAAWGVGYRRREYPGLRWAVGLLWGLALWLYTYHLFLVAPRAVWRELRGRTGWAKTRRNAELTVAGAPTALEV
ncbi:MULTISPECIES: glycosyltransferase [Kitasatospora]|uniref:Glycosyltransferase n=1 Tax=Kitasatospora setae (strain ATCC 33774 / DSM 43861 / JCM 3304 / KCC A-0304 / NBRC 14216 / KM-6054) TaxID=452652 RepID=E4NB51_KITSK|nr:MULTISPECIES: glycosyltransferase [Kitasatospora]BAJ28432.1 hypothetical protein KSE_26200 [Kitasatospora setae KM-6054]